MRVVVELTQREADELLRAEIRPRGVRPESLRSVECDVDSAAIKLRAAIDKASRA